jgi:5-methylcytosine-specific restriction enzyme subunit McrC
MYRARVSEYGRLWVQGRGSDVRWADGWTDTVPSVLFDRLRDADIRRRKQKLEPVFDWSYRDFAKANSVVGVVNVPGAQVEVLPKIHRAALAAGIHNADNAQTPLRERADLLHMLRYAGIIETTSDQIAHLAGSRTPFGDTLVRLFADGLIVELQRGMPREYLRRRGDLPFIRGRVDWTRQLTRNVGRPHVFACRYDVFDTDHELHRVFKATARALLDGHPSAQTEERLRTVISLLDDVEDTPLTTDTADRVQIDRRLSRFGTALDFCRLVARGMGTESRQGEWRSHSLLFDMNVVYEGFVAGFIDAELLKRPPAPFFQDCRQWVQGGESSRYLVYRPGEPPTGLLRLKPDILLRCLGNAVVIDTKWKVPALKGGRVEPAREDLYQMYAYAREYGAKVTILLYPETASFARTDYRIEEGNGNPIWVRGLPIPDDLGSASGRETVRNALMKMIMDAFN